MGRAPAELPLSVESLRIWRRLNQEIGAETGFRECGIAYLYDTPREIAASEAWYESARDYQLGARRLRDDEIDALLPGSARKWPSALYTATDGRAEPSLAAPAIAAAAARAGAHVLTQCAVRGVETSAGRVSAVITERGRIDCQSVILAGGAWSRLFLGNFGVDFPQLKILGSVMRTAPLTGAPETSVGSSNFAFRKRLDGGYTITRRGANVSQLTPDSFRLIFDFLPTLKAQWRELRLRVGRRFLEEWNIPRRWPLDAPSPFEAVRVLDPAPNRGILDEGHAYLSAAYPVFRRAEIVERWAGLIDVTPDAVPVIAPVNALPGLFLASGFSGHGFGIGPASGRLIADLVAGDRPIVDPAPFRFERFARAA
jgi:glycine/D-amino acid oxidase-like deaminating enzyme